MATTMTTFLSDLCDEAGVTYRDCGKGHVKLYGKRTVNYYPRSKKRTAYVEGVGTQRRVSPEQAVALALDGEVKVERSNKEDGRRTPTLATVFYEGERPPWEFEGPFQFLCEADAERYNDRFHVRHPVPDEWTPDDMDGFADSLREFAETLPVDCGPATLFELESAAKALEYAATKLRERH